MDLIGFVHSSLRVKEQGYRENMTILLEVSKAVEFVEGIFDPKYGPDFICQIYTPETAGTWKSPVWKEIYFPNLHFGVLC